MNDQLPSYSEVLLMALGDEIRYWRRRRRMSRDQLAAAVGTSASTIGRAEREGPADVSVTWLIAKALDVPFSEMIRRAEHAIGFGSIGAPEDLREVYYTGSTSVDDGELPAAAKEGGIEGSGEDSI